MQSFHTLQDVDVSQAAVGGNTGSVSRQYHFAHGSDWSCSTVEIVYSRRIKTIEQSMREPLFYPVGSEKRVFYEQNRVNKVNSSEKCSNLQ